LFACDCGLGEAGYLADFTFFSFVTLTTTGYGDMVPVTGYAKSLALLESVVGVMYPAVRIGRLISLSQANASQGKKVDT
jgi:hypothetical protein